MPESSPSRQPYELHAPGRAGRRLPQLFRGRRLGTASDVEHVVVHLSGDMTSENAGRISKRLQHVLRSGPRVLEMELGGVTYLSPDGGAVFFAALHAARPHGTRVIATHVRDRPLATLKQLGLGQAMAMYEGDGPIGSGRRGR